MSQNWATKKRYAMSLQAEGRTPLARTHCGHAEPPQRVSKKALALSASLAYFSLLPYVSMLSQRRAGAGEDGEGAVHLLVLRLGNGIPHLLVVDQDPR